MNVFSAFDGIAGARVALDRLGIECTYYASEIDKYAIKVAKKNYPDIIELGDIQQVNPFLLPKIDLMIGGSPCQDLSIAGKGAGLDGARSGLFFDFIRLKNYLQPKYFLLENVARMHNSKFNIFVLSTFMGVSPLRINSARVSAQTRDRLYWTNIPNVQQPKDRNILLKDIIEDGLVDQDKSYCIDSNYWKGKNNSGKSHASKNRTEVYLYRLPHGYITENTKQYDKYPALAAQNPDTKYLLLDQSRNNRAVRKLTPVECERLQTFDDGYTEGISSTQRYKCLGNSFTVEVIKHILSYMEL